MSTHKYKILQSMNIWAGKTCCQCVRRNDYQCTLVQERAKLSLIILNAMVSAIQAFIFKLFNSLIFIQVSARLQTKAAYIGKGRRCSSHHIKIKETEKHSIPFDLFLQKQIILLIIQRIKLGTLCSEKFSVVKDSGGGEDNGDI